MYGLEQTAIIPRPRVSVEQEPGRRDGWSLGDDPDTPGQVRALTTIAWLLPTICMAALGMVRLTWSSLSADELDYWAFAVTPWDRATAILGSLDSGTVPYHLALKGWSQAFGTSDLSLRAPSVLAMAIAAGLVAGIGAKLSRPQTGFIAGIVFAFLPGVSRLAQEIGPGAASVCLAALSTLLFIKILDRRSAWTYVAYAFVVLLLGLVSPVALLAVPGHGVAALLMRRRVFLGWLIAAVVGAFPTLTAHVVLGPPSVHVGLDSAGRFLSAVELGDGLFGAALVAGAVAGLSLLSVSFRKPAVVYTCWAVIPLLILYAVSRVGLGWEPRTLAFTLGGWALLAAHALHRAPAFRGVVAGAILAAFCLPAQIDVRERAGHGLASAELGAIIAGQAEEGDVAVFGPGPKSGLVGRDIVQRYVPDQIRPKDALAVGSTRSNGQVLVSECTDVEKCLNGALRVWLVRTDRPDTPLSGLPTEKAEPLANLYDVEKTWYLEGLLLTRLTLKPTAPDQVASD